MWKYNIYLFSRRASFTDPFEIRDDELVYIQNNRSAFTLPFDRQRKFLMMDESHPMQKILIKIMAIIDCPECGKKVSDKAELCPHCHKKVIKVATVNQPSYTSSNDRLNIESSVRNLKSKNKLWFLWIGIAFIIVAGIVTSIWIPVEKNNKKKLLEKEFQAFNQSKLQMSDLESIWKEGDNFFEYKEKLRNKGFKNKDNEDELYIELTNPSNGNIYTCSVLQGCGAHFCNIYVEFGNYIDALEFYEQVKGISALVEEHYDWSTDTYTNWYARWFLDGNTVRWDYDN